MTSRLTSAGPTNTLSVPGIRILTCPDDPTIPSMAKRGVAGAMLAFIPAMWPAAAADCWLPLETSVCSASEIPGLAINTAAPAAAPFRKSRRATDAFLDVNIVVHLGVECAKSYPGFICALRATIAADDDPNSGADFRRLRCTVVTPPTDRSTVLRREGSSSTAQRELWGRPLWLARPDFRRRATIALLRASHPCENIPLHRTSHSPEN